MKYKRLPEDLGGLEPPVRLGGGFGGFSPDNLIKVGLKAVYTIFS